DPETSGPFSSSECEYKAASLVVDFGILREGAVAYVVVHSSSGLQLYDQYAINAVKLANPFPPVPGAMMERMKPGSTGAAIRARFVYQLEVAEGNPPPEATSEVPQADDPRVEHACRLMSASIPEHVNVDRRLVYETCVKAKGTKPLGVPTEP